MRTNQKRGIVIISAVAVRCPACAEAVEDDNGCTELTESQFDTLPRTIVCVACGEHFRKPAPPVWNTQVPAKMALAWYITEDQGYEDEVLLCTACKTAHAPDAVANQPAESDDECSICGWNYDEHGTEIAAE